MRRITKLTIITGLLLLAAIPAAHAQNVKTANTPCRGANGLTETEITQVLAEQNKARAAASLPALSWNCQLADLAQAWATRGIAEHRPDNDYGENIFVASNAGVSPMAAIQRWLAEGAFWNSASGECQEGKICVHFTQIMWGNTKNIGCGINRAATGKWPVLMVCNYDPAGNTGSRQY